MACVIKVDGKPFDSSMDARQAQRILAAPLVEAGAASNDRALMEAVRFMNDAWRDVGNTLKNGQQSEWLAINKQVQEKALAYAAYGQNGFHKILLSSAGSVVIINSPLPPREPRPQPMPRGKHKVGRSN